jgi:hypothetical protein
MLEANQCGSAPETLLFRCKYADYSLKIYGFAICGPAHLRKLRICDCGMSPKICVPTFVWKHVKMM